MLRRRVPLRRSKPLRRNRKPLRRMSAKRKREQPTIARVRAHCYARDGACRLDRGEDFGDRFGFCLGVSEWAHFGEQKRFKTRGQKPHQRHTKEGSLMLCTRHHDMYDHGTGENKIVLEALSAEGCEGGLVVRRGDQQAIV